MPCTKYTVKASFRDALAFQDYLKAAGVPVQSISSARADETDVFVSGSLSAALAASLTSLAWGYQTPAYAPAPAVFGTVTAPLLVSTAASLTTLSVAGNVSVAGSVSAGTVTAARLVVPNARAGFTGLMSELGSLSVGGVYAGTTSCSNVKLWAGSTTTTSSGVATLTPANSTGGPMFSKILWADAKAWANASGATACPIVSGKSIAADGSSVSFNVVQGVGLLAAGASLAMAPAGVNVNALLIGL